MIGTKICCLLACCDGMNNLLSVSKQLIVERLLEASGRVPGRGGWSSLLYLYFGVEA